jgi:hypothetical protein
VRHSVTMLSTAFRAFYDLHKPGYLAYAAARLPRDEAVLAVAHTFGLIAADWSSAVARRNPAAYAWQLHTRYVSAVTGAPCTRADEARLLHDGLHLTVNRIATLTGNDPAAVTVLLASAD